MGIESKYSDNPNIQYKEVEMSDLAAAELDDELDDDIVWLSDNDTHERRAAAQKPRVSCFQVVIFFFVAVSAAAVLAWTTDFGDSLDFASPSRYVTNAPTVAPSTFAPTLEPTSETTIFTTTVSLFASTETTATATPQTTTTSSEDKPDLTSPPTQYPTQRDTEEDKPDPTLPPTQYPTQRDTEEDSKSQDDEEDDHVPTNTIVDGVEDWEIYCEDLSIYEEWHKIPVTRKSGIQYRVVEQLDHDKYSFTQGLTYARGKLFESAGLTGRSTVRILDPDTADVELKVPMEHKYFAEGMTYYKDRLVQITWKLQDGFVYNITTLEEIDRFKFSTTKNEGWGITWDRCKDEFIVTDGSANLHFWDTTTMEEKRRVPVKRIDGSPAKNMNEIEFWRGRVLANVWFEDVILVIDPETGRVEKEYDFSQLWSKHDRKIDNADVLNGISISDTPDTLYFTGKLWDRMYRIQLLPEL